MSSLPPDSFNGKHVVVTGAGAGIGQAIARQFCADGATVWALDLSEESLQATLAAVRDTTGSLQPVPCDVGDYEAVGATLRRPPRIDVLVNNAGIAHVGNVEQTRPEDMDRLYRVNIKGVYHCLHHALPRMVAGGSGVVLNLASIASKVGIQDRFAYSMTKGAVLSMTLSVARDYVDRGVRCNCICPARVHTPFVDGFLDKNYPNDRKEMYDKLSAYQPIGRMGTPEEIAAVAVFLCSDQASFITGSAYDVDGGVTLLR